jgi:hypothetical protein
MGFFLDEQPLRSYKIPQEFFTANENLIASCTTVQCLDLNKKQPIKHIFESFLNSQANDQDNLLLNPDSQVPFLHSKNPKTGSQFLLNCANVYYPEERQALGFCNGYVQGKDVHVKEVYKLEEKSNGVWKESLFLSETESELHLKFSNQDNPKLFEKFIKSDQPGPLNAVLLTMGTAVALYCIYKISSIAAKRWGKEPQKEKPLIISPTNIEPKIGQIKDLKIREVLFSFPLEVHKSSQMKELINFIDELQKENPQKQKEQLSSHTKFQSIFLSFSEKVRDSHSMSKLVILLETNFPAFAEKRMQEINATANLSSNVVNSQQFPID